MTPPGRQPGRRRGDRRHQAPADGNTRPGRPGTRPGQRRHGQPLAGAARFGEEKASGRIIGCGVQAGPGVESALTANGSLAQPGQIGSADSPARHGGQGRPHSSRVTARDIYGHPPRRRRRPRRFPPDTPPGPCRLKREPDRWPQASATVHGPDTARPRPGARTAPPPGTGPGHRHRGSRPARATPLTVAMAGRKPGPFSKPGQCGQQGLGGEIPPGRLGPAGRPTAQPRSGRPGRPPGKRHRRPRPGPDRPAPEQGRHVGQGVVAGQHRVVRRDVAAGHGTAGTAGGPGSQGGDKERSGQAQGLGKGGLAEVSRGQHPAPGRQVEQGRRAVAVKAAQARTGPGRRR